MHWSSCTLRLVIFNLILKIDVLSNPCEIIYCPQVNATRPCLNDLSTLIQVMASYCQAPSHYRSQCWPRSLSPYMVSLGHNELKCLKKKKRATCHDKEKLVHLRKFSTAQISLEKLCQYCACWCPGNLPTDYRFATTSDLLSRVTFNKFASLSCYCKYSGRPLQRPGMSL